MIKEPDNIRLPTASDDKVEVLLNWNEDIKGEFIKMRINDEKEIIIPRYAFSKVAILLASEDEQVEMIPMKRIPVRHLKKTVTIQLKKDMRAGQEITIPVSFDIPLSKSGELPIIH